MTESRPRILIHRLAKLTHFCVNIIALCSNTPEISNTAKRSIFKSVFVPILTCGHDYWVITEKKNTTSGASGGRGIFAESTVQHEGRTEARLRPGQETSLAPPCSNLRPFRNKRTELKSQRKRSKRHCYRRFDNS